MDKLSKKDLNNFKKLLLKKYRYEKKCFLVEGKHLVEEAWKTNFLKFIITSNKNYRNDNISVKYCSYEEIIKLSTTKKPQDIIGICNFFNQKPLGNKIILLNNINDPGNLGTIIRTARAFGFSDVIVEGVDIYNPKVLRSSQGSIFGVNIYNIKSSINFLEQNKNEYSIIGTLLDKKATSFEKIESQLKTKVILVLGNESSGINKKIHKYLEYKVYIPIEFESLNIAIAGAIIMEKIHKKIDK